MDPSSTTRKPGLAIAIAGRFATDLAVIAVAVPLIVELFVPELPAGCGMTPERTSLALGLTFLGARLAWRILKASNEMAERWLGSLQARNVPDTPPRISTP